MGDHTDRHYALVANNQHPMQLYLYDFLNKKYRQAKDRKDYEEGKSNLTYEIALEERVKQLIDERLSTLDVTNGEDLTPEDIRQIYKEAVHNVREKLNLSTCQRGKDGNVEDYLEIRRPLGHQENRI